MILNDCSNLHFLRIAENLTAANTASKSSCLGWRKQLSSGSWISIRIGGSHRCRASGRKIL